MPSNGGPRQVRFAVPASTTVLSPAFTLGSMPPTMDRSGSRSPPPAMDVAELNRDLPQVRSPGWRLVMRQVLAEEEYDFGFRATGPRPSDQHQWNADDLASLRQERMGRELERELSMAADVWAANQAAFEAAARAGAYGFADDDPITIGEMLQRRFYDNYPNGGDSPASVNGMESDEDYDSDMHSHLAFGMECETPTSSRSSVVFEGGPEVHRLSLEIPVAHIEAEIMSDSTGSDGNYMSDSSPISIPDPEVQPSTPMSDATDDSEWLPTESSSTTSESDMDHTSDTDDNLQTIDDLTNTVDDILELVFPVNSLTREAFLTYAHTLVSMVDAEFDDVQIDELVTHLRDSRDNGERDPIGVFADLCLALGLLG
ncbi:hypothetical protein KC349_g5175 [Hortaea werneckii]|nr:hypothetical protein KC349_g5175 [Hortaea werneckii]